MKVSNLPEFARIWRDHLSMEAWENLDHSRNWTMYVHSVSFCVSVFYIIVCVCVCVCVCVWDQWIGKEVNGVTNTGVAGMTKVSYPRLTSENWNIFLWKWRTHIEIQIYLKVIIFFFWIGQIWEDRERLQCRMNSFLWLRWI